MEIEPTADTKLNLRIAVNHTQKRYFIIGDFFIKPPIDLKRGTEYRFGLSLCSEIIKKHYEEIKRLEDEGFSFGDVKVWYYNPT